MLKKTTYFLHGLDSSGKGTKGQFFTKNFPQVVCPNFEGTLANRLLQLEAHSKNQQQLTLIGSSFGGLIATCYAIKHPGKITQLVLLAPALNFEGYQPPAELLQIPTLIIIGKHDTVTPPALVAPLAEATFTDLEIRIENDDHMLHSTFQHLDWQKILVG